MECHAMLSAQGPCGGFVSQGCFVGPSGCPQIWFQQTPRSLTLLLASSGVAVAMVIGDIVPGWGVSQPNRGKSQLLFSASFCRPGSSWMPGPVGRLITLGTTSWRSDLVTRVFVVRVVGGNVLVGEEGGTGVDVGTRTCGADLAPLPVVERVVGCGVFVGSDVGTRTCGADRVAWVRSVVDVRPTLCGADGRAAAELAMVAVMRMGRRILAFRCDLVMIGLYGMKCVEW